MTNLSLSTAQFFPLEEAVGELRYKFTNDYLFRATFQRNKTALLGLVCSLLGLKPEEVLSVDILNPIELGRSINDKDFFLDIRVLLNNNTYVNIEMQIMNFHNFPERSLGYLCRSFDHLNKGQDYQDTKSVVQVCFLDFTLFPDTPEFNASYSLMNQKNYRIYSDKMHLIVIDLTQIDLSTEEDKLRGIDYWAKLFKATTWEEIRMLTENNTFLREAAATAYQLSAEEKIRLQCEAREDYYKLQRSIEKRQQMLEKQCEESEKTLKQLNQELEQTNNDLAQANNDLVQANNDLVQANNELIQANRSLAEKDREIARLKALLNQIP